VGVGWSGGEWGKLTAIGMTTRACCQHFEAQYFTSNVSRRSNITSTSQHPPGPTKRRPTRRRSSKFNIQYTEKFTKRVRMATKKAESRLNVCDKCSAVAEKFSNSFCLLFRNHFAVNMQNLHGMPHRFDSAKLPCVYLKRMMQFTKRRLARRAYEL